jgi:broad specificity phosphatase PhoE
MTTRLYLVRHGATPASASDRFAGTLDTELSAEGRDQANALGRRLANEPLVAVYASPLRRTVDTASRAVGARRLEVIRREGLREISYGRWEGLTRDEVATRFPDEYRQWTEDPFSLAPQGGESGAEVMARGLPVIRELVERYTGSVVLVVSHKATIRLTLCAVLGIDPRGYRDRFDQAPGCLNAVDFADPGRARLMLYNDISHYAGLTSSPGDEERNRFR